MSITVEQLTAAYEEEKKNNRPPVTADDVPFTYDAITPAWLTVVLCDQHPGAKVVSHRLDVPDDGNSNRIRIFVEYNTAGKKAGLPERVFCKASQGLANRISLGPPGAIQAEVNFYNQIRPSLAIEAPFSYYARFNAALNSIIIMRELDPATTFCTHTTDITRARVEDQLRVLAAFHGKYLESPELQTSLAIFNSWTNFFKGMDYANFEKACDQGFGIAEEVIPGRMFKRRQEIWPLTQKSYLRHEQLPHTLNHGDDHLRNWYITPVGAMGLNDWQAATRGHWSRDVIYAITTSLTVENRRKWLPDLLHYYHDQLQECAGRKVAFDGTLDECRRQLFTVLAFWTITINPAPGMPDMQPRDSTLEFIRRIALAIDDLDAMDSFK